MSGQILVVDGTATHRITLKVRLAAACYDPLTARTGAEALAILARARPTLVLIGGEPGDMGAVDLCGRIAAGWPGVPVLMIVPQADRIAALKAGAAAVLDASAKRTPDAADGVGSARGRRRNACAAPSTTITGSTPADRNVVVTVATQAAPSGSRASTLGIP